MAKKVELRKKINNSVEVIYPKTIATNVYMSNGKTVEARITELQTDLTTLANDWASAKAKLYLDSLYMRNSNGDLLDDGSTLNDGSGLNLVAVY